MANSTYEHILSEIEQLTRHERQELRRTLDTLDQPVTSGMAYVNFLRSVGPLDPAIADEMERAIEEGCERIEPDD